MKKKTYVSPNVLTLEEIQGIVPLAAIAAGVTTVASSAASVATIGAALAGGYAIGRVVKSIEIRGDVAGLHALRKVSE